MYIVPVGQNPSGSVRSRLTSSAFPQIDMVADDERWSQEGDI